MHLIIPKRTLGRTGLEVSALSLGTVELGIVYGIQIPGQEGQPSSAQAQKLLQHAIASGINYIDTAPAYGTSESVIGAAIKDVRAQVILATKVGCLDAQGQPLRGNTLRDTVQTSVEQSLKRLQTDWIDLLQVHNLTEPLLQAGEVAGYMQHMVAQGKVRFIGASVYGPDAALAVVQDNHFDTLQVAYNVIDQRMENQVLPLARERGVGIITRSALLKGALTPKGDYLPSHLDQLKQQSQRFRQLSAQYIPQATAVQAAIAFCLSNPRISTVLVGANNIQELDEDIGAVAFPPHLSPAMVAELRGLRLSDEKLLNPATWGIP
ncbi:MAG: aldo/keto reductase [Chloroflexi bacterium]|nr:aldo/keto reductase [Chloroflexota bacterium]